MPRIHTVAADGVITAGDKLIGSDGGQDKNFVTRNYTVGGVKDFILNGTHAGSFTTLTTTGNATIGGNVTIAGNITVGDADTDTVSFAADVISNIIPDVTNTYNLGSSAKKWKDLHLQGSAKAGNIWLDGTLNEISGVTNLYAQKMLDSNDSTYFVQPGAGISAKFKGNIQLGDALAETNAEITSFGDLILKADVDNDGPYDRGVEICRTRGGNDGGNAIDFNRTQYDLAGQSLPVSIFNQIVAGKKIYGLGGGANFQNVASATIVSVTGWMDADGNVLGTVLDEPPVGATKLRVLMNPQAISYSNSAFLTVLASSATFNEDVTRNIKFFSGTTELASFNKDGKFTVKEIDAGANAITTTGTFSAGSITATGTIVANNTDTINGININNSNQEMSGVGDIYAYKFYDSQDTNYYIDPGHSTLSIKTAGGANIAGININASNKEVSGVGDLYAYKFIDAQTGTHYLDPGNSNLSLVTAGKVTIGAFTIPKTIGTSGQVLQVPSSGTELEWSNATGIPHIINYTNNTNSVSVGYSAWAAGGPQTGDGGAIENVALGIGAMNSILQGDGNVSVGYNANTGLSFGDFNIAIGHKAGASSDSSATNLTTGDRNILIGANTGVDNAGTFNAIIIGTHHDIDNGDGIVASSHQTIIGNDQTNNAVVKGLRQEVRTSPATDTLSDVRGTDANKITLLDSTSAITITLPDSGSGTEIGKTYTFVVKTAATGGDIHKIVCSDTTNEKIIGSWSMAYNSEFYAFEANNFSAINMNGTTQSGVAGTVFSLTCIATDLWLLSNAFPIHSGSASTPFSTS